MRNKTNIILYILLLWSILYSCGPEPQKAEYMSGYVKDIDGYPLANVVVSTNGNEVKTDKNGFFAIENVKEADGRYIVKFAKQGYFPVVRSEEFGSTLLTEVVLILEEEKDVSTRSTIKASKGGKISIGKMTVDIPSNGLMYENGTPYKGEVNVNMLYLDPTKPTFQAAMPGGDLIARRTNSEEVPLVSYGMVNVIMKDKEGKKLQISEGEKSKVTFPIPAGMEKNAPDQMPLWHFNEESGIWEESGKAYKNGDVYEGEVEHFSWVNLDDPKEIVTLKGNVRDSQGNPLAGIKVIIEQVSAFTNSEGEYNVQIPSETDVKVTVRKEDYYNYDDVFSVVVEGQPGNTTYTQDIDLPSLPTIYGMLGNTCDENVVFPIYCKYRGKNGKETSPLTLPREDGFFSIKVPSSAKDVTVCVKVPGGQDVEEEIEFAGEDYEMRGNISICRKKVEERDKPHLTIEGDDIPIESNEILVCELLRKNNEIILEGESGTEIRIYNYNETDEYMDGKIIIKDYQFTSTSARINKKKIGNKIRISITATGKVGEENGDLKDAIVEGSYLIPCLYYGPCDDFDKVCWDPAIPKMRTPINKLEQEYLAGMAVAKIFYDEFSMKDIEKLAEIKEDVDPLILYVEYKKADKETYEKVVKYLNDLGYTESQNGKNITYEKNDIIIGINREGNNKLNKLDAEMEIAVSTGFKKWIKNLIRKYLGINI